jgi:hypothetical protein
MQRAKDPTSVPFSQVTGLVLAMRDKLDGMYDMVPSGDFFAARHFLEALADEARYTGFDRVASTAN